MIERFERFTAAISSIYKTIQKIERAQMARYGLKGAHVRCIVAMRNYPEGISFAQLCDLCETDKAAVSRTVAELERKGLLLRECEADKVYRAPLKLTQAGRSTADQISGIIRSAVEMAGESLGDEERQVLYGSLELIANNLHRISAGGLPIENMPKGNEE